MDFQAAEQPEVSAQSMEIPPPPKSKVSAEDDPAFSVLAEEEMAPLSVSSKRRKIGSDGTSVEGGGDSDDENEKEQIPITMTERDLPQSIVKKMLKASAPKFNFSKDFTMAATRATSIYLMYLTQLTFEKCKRMKRTTMDTPHIIDSLANLEFEFTADVQDYVEDLKNGKFTNTSTDEIVNAENEAAKSVIQESGENKKRGREETVGDEKHVLQGGTVADTHSKDPVMEPNEKMPLPNLSDAEGDMRNDVEAAQSQVGGEVEISTGAEAYEL